MQKNLAINSLYNILGKGFNIAYPMIVSAYISRIFQADGVGKVSFVINIVTYFSIAASLGIPNYAIKLLSANRNDRQELDRNFSEMAFIIAIASIVVSAVYFLFTIFFYKQKSDDCKMALVLGLMLVSNVFNYDWLYESMEDYRYLAIRSVVIKTFALVAMFVGVKKKSDLVIYCFIYAMVTVLNNVANRLTVNRYTSFTFKNLRIRCHLKPIFILFAAAIATDLYTLLDSTMLGLKCEPEYLGYYSNASRVVRASFGIIYAAVAVYNPRLSLLYKNNKNEYRTIYQSYYNQAMILAIPATVGLFLLSDNVINTLFGVGFGPASFTLKVLSGLIVVFSFAVVFGHIPLVIYGEEKYILLATAIGACINFTLNQILIPIFLQNGAALASVISEIVVTIILMVKSLGIYKIKLINKNIMQILVGTVAMATGLTALIFFLDNSWVTLIVEILFGVIIYFVCLLMQKNVYVCNVNRLIKKKLSELRW